MQAASIAFLDDKYTPARALPRSTLRFRCLGKLSLPAIVVEWHFLGTHAPAAGFHDRSPLRMTIAAWMSEMLGGQRFSRRAKALTNDVSRLLVFTKAEEPRASQFAFARPLVKAIWAISLGCSGHHRAAGHRFRIGRGVVAATYRIKLILAYTCQSTCHVLCAPPEFFTR